MSDPDVEFPHDDLHPPRPAGRDRTGQPIDIAELEAMWAEPQNRVVLFTSLVEPDGTRVAVSTIWLGIDHAFEGDPLVYETAVFDGSGLLQRHRHRDEAAAQAGHVEALLQLLARGRLSPSAAERIVTGSLPVLTPQPTPAPRKPAAVPFRPAREPSLDEIAESIAKRATGPIPIEGGTTDDPESPS